MGGSYWAILALIIKAMLYIGHVRWVGGWLANIVAHHLQWYCIQRTMQIKVPLASHLPYLPLSLNYGHSMPRSAKPQAAPQLVWTMVLLNLQHNALGCCTTDTISGHPIHNQVHDYLVHSCYTYQLLCQVHCS